jgi:hypothetical protein
MEKFFEIEISADSLANRVTLVTQGPHWGFIKQSLNQHQLQKSPEKF